MTRMYLLGYDKHTVHLGVANTNDQAEVSWLDRAKLYEEYPLDVVIVPAARNIADDKARAERVATLTESVKSRCSTVGVELVDELVRAVTDDIAQRYEAIIKERVETEVERLRPLLRKEERGRLSEERDKLQLETKTKLRDQAKGMLEGVRELQRLAANITEVFNQTARNVDLLHAALNGEVRTLEHQDCGCGEGEDCPNYDYEDDDYAGDDDDC